MCTQIHIYMVNYPVFREALWILGSVAVGLVLFGASILWLFR